MGAPLSRLGLLPERPFTEADARDALTPAGRLRRLRARARRRRDRGRARALPKQRWWSCKLNQCRTDWPGGFRCGGRPSGGWIATAANIAAWQAGTAAPRGAPPAAAGNWVATGFSGGKPTNPRCYPPSGQEHQDTGNTGTFADARQAATLAHTNPDATAAAINGILAAVARGTLSETRAGQLIHGLTAPALAASQAAGRIEPLTPAQLAERRAARQTRADLLGALSLREVADACRTPRGPAYCATSWPGGWIDETTYIERGRPKGWKGPTEYGKFLPGCFGHQYNALDTVGQWIIRTTRGAPAAIAQPALRVWQHLVPTPAGAPSPPAAPPAEQWMCREGWPGGWMTVEQYAAAGRPAGWRGPTAYGARVPGCFPGAGA